MRENDQKRETGALERNVRAAIANGLEPHEVLEIVRELTDAYEQYDDPALIAREDLASIFH
jgi:chorismate mutase